MNMQTVSFSGFLNNRLEATDVYLPLCEASRADLLNILAEENSYIYLTLRGDTQMETVRARAEGGYVIIDRGLEGTTAVLHHHGTCVSSVSPTVIAVIKDLICNYSCCEDGDCPCTAVSYAGAVLPNAFVGQAWGGSVVFAGDPPFNMGVDDAPSWMQVSQVGNMLQLSGTPAFAGTFSFSVAATNCNGTQIATKVLSVTVTS